MSITREIPVMPEQSWRFYDGMTRERFDELKAAGALPITIGDYDDVMRIVAEGERRARSEGGRLQAMKIVGEKVTATINGRPVELENFSFDFPRTTPDPRTLEPKEWTVDMTVHADAEQWATFRAAILASWSRPRYWWRRQQHHVRRFRKHMARALGVSYRDMLHFCRTGRWELRGGRR